MRIERENSDVDLGHDCSQKRSGLECAETLSPQGLPEFVDFDYIARVARVNAVALAALANAPGAPKNVRIAGGLAYDAALRWNANTEADLAGYEVVWRKTEETDWTHVIPVGLPEPDASGVVRYTAPLSKDDFFFGVRAVDTDGNRSPVVFPRP